MIATAKLKYLGVSAQKTRLVVDQVRGKSLGEAQGILLYSRKLVAKDLKKLLDSAWHNAQQKDAKLDPDRLFVSRATVDEGPPQKRLRHRSMGRVYRIIKRTCHVTIELDQAASRGRNAAAGGR